MRLAIFYASTATFSVALSLLVFGCGSVPPAPPNAEDRAESPALVDPSPTNDVVYTNMQVTQGQDIWDEFVGKCDSGQECSIRIVFHTDTKELAYPPEFRGEINFPNSSSVSEYYADIHFDGAKYSYSYATGGTICTEEYRFMCRFSGKPSNQSAGYDEYAVYVLLNDNAVTWDQIVFSHASSQYPTRIQHRLVYVNLGRSQDGYIR
jgi:hypothetical protein